MFGVFHTRKPRHSSRNNRHSDKPVVRRPPRTTVRKPEIDALAALPTEEQVHQRLGSIASVYGKVHSILTISSRQVALQLDPEECLFLVNFERTLDAMVAAVDTGCYLFGFTALAVPVKRNGRSGNCGKHVSPPPQQQSSRAGAFE